MKILLDYFFPITSIEPTPQASTAFLKQACLVVKPAMDVETGVITLCTSMAAVAALTDNEEAQQLFDAGMNRVYILPMDDLDLIDALELGGSDFYTLLISSDFSDEDVTLTKASGNVVITSYANLVSGTDDSVTVGATVFTAQTGAATLGTGTFQAATSDEATAASLAAQINAHPVANTLVAAEVDPDALDTVLITALEFGVDGNDIALAYTDNDTNVGATVSGAFLAGGSGLLLGSWEGVTGVSSDDDAYLEDQVVLTNRAAFHSTTTNKAKNMLYAFGKMLSNALNWRNQQYITMPFADDVDTLGDANALFDSKISFVISDDEFGERLALFSAQSKAIVAPYIKRNLQIDWQSAALSFVSGNQPAYTLKNAALLQDELEKVIQSYIDREWIEAGTVAVTLVQDNFVASAEMNIAEPKALWRIFGEMRQTL